MKKVFYVSLTYLATYEVDETTEDNIRELIADDEDIPERFGLFNLNDVEVSEGR